MRHLLLATALLASLIVPLHARAQDEEQDTDMAAMVDYLSEGIPQADFGKPDEHGWFLKQENGVCTMSSFNDALALQFDPANALTTMLIFQVFDGDIAEAEGTRIPVLLGVRDTDGSEYAVFDASVAVSHSPLPAYLMPAPLADMVRRYPNGFQLLLKDKATQATLGASDTIGSGPHLAGLVACGK